MWLAMESDSWEQKQGMEVESGRRESQSKCLTKLATVVDN